MKSAYGRGTPSWGMEEKEPLHKRGHIVELYSEYIDSMGFGNETESRQRVVDVVNNFLNLVGTPSKFITDDFLDIFTSCIEGSFPSSISASELVGVAEAFCLLEDFILRLVTEPWRPDSRSLKLYNSFFVNSVLPFVPEAAKIFTLLGYVSQPNNLLVLPPAAAIDSAAASAVSCDLLIAACETRVLLAVYDLLRGSGGSGGVSVEDVWKERKISVCSVDSCAKLISAKRRLKSASPTPSSSSFKPPANPSSTPPDFPVPHFGVTSSGSVSRRHPVNSLTRRSPLRSSLPSAKPTSGLSAEATTPASASSPSRSVASMHRLSLRDEARPLAKPASASRPISAEGLHQNELNASLTVTSLEATPNASSFGRGGAGGGFGSGRLLADSLTDDNDAEFASTKFYPSDEVNRRSFYDNDGFDALASQQQQQQQQHHHGSPATQLENGFTNSSSSSHHPQQHHHHHQLQQQQQQKPFTLSSSFAAPDSSASFRLGAKVDLPLSGALSSASSDVPISVSSNSYRDSSSSAAAAAAAKIPDWPRDKSLAVSSSGVVSTGSSSSSSSKASSSHRVVKIPIHVVSSNQKPKAFVTTKLGVSPSSAPSAANANARPSAAVQIPVRRETPPQSSPLTQRANHVVNVLSDDGGGDASYDEEDDEDYDDEEFDDGAGKFQRRSPTRDSYRNAIQAGGAAPPGASGLDLLDAYAAMSLSDFADSHGISQTSTLPISGLRSKNSDVSQRSLPVVYRNSLKKATKRPDPSHHSLQPRSDVERRWTCSSCTYSNSNSLAVCEMCHRSKGSARKTNLKSGGHQCPQCTLVNDKGVMTCNACGHNLEGCPTYI